MFFWIIKLLAFIPFWLIYPTKIKKLGKIPKGKVVFVANHRSNLDPLIMLNMFWREQHVVAKKELYKNKLLAAFLKGMKTIPVDRSKVELTTIKQCLSVLKKNKTLTIFPEGTRNKTDKPLVEIKEGAGLIAIKGDAPIVPIWIKKKPKPFCLNTIYVGDAIHLKKEDLQHSNEIIKNELLSLREKTLKKNKQSNNK